MLIAQPTGADSKDVVGAHLDDTVAIAGLRKNVRHVAYRVTVLYLQVPRGIKGELGEIG